MEKGYVTLIGMSIAYVASFLGLWLAWYGWKKRRNEDVKAPVNTGFVALELAVLLAWYVWGHRRPAESAGFGMPVAFVALIALIAGAWGRWAIRYGRNHGKGEAAS